MCGEFDLDICYGGWDSAGSYLPEELDRFFRFFILAADLGVDVAVGIDPASVRLSSSTGYDRRRQITS